MKQNTKLAQRIYAILLRLYPAGFRRGYSQELILLFMDMYRVAAARGRRALVSFWLDSLLDLFSNAAKERIRTMFNPKWAPAVSLILFLPLLFLYSMALLPYEPAFLEPLLDFLFPPDDQLGIAQIYLLLSSPIAFLINLLPLLRGTESRQITSFRATRSHTVIGSSILVMILIVFSPLILDYLVLILDYVELRVNPLGLLSPLVQVLFLLLFLPLPTLFLLGRLPRVRRAGSESTLVLQPASFNLIIGAALLLVVLMELSSFVLNATACSIWHGIFLC